MFIGKRLKTLRKEKKMSLTELSALSKVQMATLSRIENMKMAGTLQSHMNIARALGLTLPQLYSDIAIEEQPIAQERPEPQKNIFVHSDKASFEVLTNNMLSKKMMPMLLKLEPGGHTNKEQNSTGTEKFIFVLEGSIEMKIGDKNYTLSKHNTLYFDASLPYYIENKGKTTAKVLCVGTPVTL